MVKSQSENEKHDNERLIAAFDEGLPCGALAQTLARKALATAFVGAFAGSLALGEVLRGLHGGVRCETANIQLRSICRKRVFIREEQYQVRAASSGCLSALRY